MCIFLLMKIDPVKYTPDFIGFKFHVVCVSAIPMKLVQSSPLLTRWFYRR